MQNSKRGIVVIPARGGSKGIPRKNLRLLASKPLIFYVISTALSSRFDLDVYVSSDDDEILNVSEKFGAKSHYRDSSLAADNTTLDPVIFQCCQYAEQLRGKPYDFVITMQPTSPLLKVESLDRAINMLLDNNVDTVISAYDSTHLSWRKEEGRFLPNYEERVNRQYLTPTYQETGGVVVSRRKIVKKNTRIGENVSLLLLSGGQEIDIDTYDDWNLCEYHLKRKHVLFVVTGNSEIGLGHVYNTLLIANDILDHQVTFLVDKDSQLAFDKIALKNYPVHIQTSHNIVDDVLKLSPDLVISDRLDTELSYVRALKVLGIKTVNFEDLGEGAQEADLVINAIYPENRILPNHYYGQKYFVLRDEFIYSEQKKSVKQVESILLSFGGVDPNNYTEKVLRTIYSYCQKRAIHITVIAGFGYQQLDSLSGYPMIDIERNVTDISRYMLAADLIFTSAGRTTYEIASLGTPAIVLAQNERELTHFFASSEYGFLNLGLGSQLNDAVLYQRFAETVENLSVREQMRKLMLQNDIKQGRKTVVKLVKDLINEMENENTRIV